MSSVTINKLKKKINIISYQKQVTAMQVTATQVSTTQVSTTQVSTTQVSTTQVSTTQVSTTQVSTTQVSTTQVSTTQVSDKEQVQVTPESTRLAAELVECGSYYLNGQLVPITGTTITPVNIISIPASLTTTQLIQNTIYASIDPFLTTTRFSEFFPPQPPPPQFLQINYYKINYEPVAPQKPCIAYRTIDS